MNNKPKEVRSMDTVSAYSSIDRTEEDFIGGVEYDQKGYLCNFLCLPFCFRDFVNLYS